MDRRRMGKVVGIVIVVSALLTACGSGPSGEEIDRSMREFQLAAGYRDEGNVPGALERLRVALELDPENFNAYLLLGVIHLGREEHEIAETNARAAVRILTERDDQASALAEARNILGVALTKQREFDEGIALLRQSASDPLNRAPWYAWGNLGQALYDQGKHTEALEALEQAVRAQPRFCVGHYVMGQTLYAMEELQRAEDALTQALEADPRCGQVYQEAWKLRGETRARLGHREEAIADFERCVELGARTDVGRSCRRLLEGN